MKNKVLYLFVFLSAFFFGQSQTTYSSSPLVGNYGSCPSSNLTSTSCNLTFLGQSTIQLTASSISGSTITFRVKKCNGTAFGSDAKFYLKESTSSNPSSVACGNSYGGSSIAGQTNGSYTYSASFLLQVPDTFVE
ncbi:MAG: hypothetical protein IPN74_16905 [Haliscomenobacter sp.]|nr:hypothetical protein [Haliscomenobacter sp.]